MTLYLEDDNGRIIGEMELDAVPRRGEWLLYDEHLWEVLKVIHEPSGTHLKVERTEG